MEIQIPFQIFSSAYGDLGYPGNDFVNYFTLFSINNIAFSFTLPFR